MLIGISKQSFSSEKVQVIIQNIYIWVEYYIKLGNFIVV